MTAIGKVTAARLVAGDRVQVTTYEGHTVPSYARRKNAWTLIVETVTPTQSGRRLGRRIVGRSLVGVPHELVVASTQTFWRSP